MYKTLLIATVIFAFTACNVSKNKHARFEGKLVYEIFVGEEAKQAIDSAKYQIIYAKDSLVRTESFTPLGKQLFIKHILKNRAYTLVDMYGENYAIQSIPDSIDNLASKYSFDYKSGKKLIAGKKANKVLVTIENLPKPVEMYYYKDISHDYTNAIPGLKGLPVEYTIFVKGEKLQYKLVSIEPKPIHIDYFGIPSDYKKLSVTEFMNLIKPDDLN